MKHPTTKENLRSKKHGTIHKAVNCYRDQSFCGQIWDYLGYERTSEKVTCKLCLRSIKSDEAWKKDERRKKLNIQVVESFKTSDGKVHNTEKAAIMQEEWLERKKTETEFAQFVREEIFENPNRELEENILKDIDNKLDWLYSEETYNLEGFSEILWNLFDGYEVVVAKALSKFRELK
jgi:hypothetical protein